MLGGMLPSVEKLPTKYTISTPGRLLSLNTA
jgi:hypothetical protein